MAQKCKKAKCDRPTNQPTDTTTYRTQCPRQKPLKHEQNYSNAVTTFCVIPIDAKFHDTIIVKLGSIFLVVVIVVVTFHSR